MEGDDFVVVRFPTREWAEAAIDDLAMADCKAELLPERDETGLWQLRVSGCPESLAAIRAGLQPPCPPIDWEAFVNAAVKRF